MRYEQDRVIEFITESNQIEGESRPEAIEDSLTAWKHLEEKEKLNYRDLLEVHRLAFGGIAPELAGRFREVDVFIGGNRKRFVSEKLFIHRLTHLLRLMRDLPEESKERGEFAKRCHVIFEDIHPFLDGNGRVGRLLWLWHRQQMELPVRIIRADWPQENGHQARYYKWFE